MDAIEVPLDRAMYERDVVLRVAHRFSGKFFVDVRSGDESWVIELTPRSPGVLPDEVRLLVQTEAVDEALRQRIRSETHGIHQVLIEAALRESLSDIGSPR